MSNRTEGERDLAGILAPLTGLGILNFVLFPLALPIVVLTVVALLPFAVLALGVGLVAAIVAAPFVAVSRLRRRFAERGDDRRVGGNDRRQSADVVVSQLSVARR